MPLTSSLHLQPPPVQTHPAHVVRNAQSTRRATDARSHRCGRRRRRGCAERRIGRRDRRYLRQIHCGAAVRVAHVAGEIVEQMHAHVAEIGGGRRGGDLMMVLLMLGLMVGVVVVGLVVMLLMVMMMMMVVVHAAAAYRARPFGGCHADEIGFRRLLAGMLLLLLML